MAIALSQGDLPRCDNEWRQPVSCLLMKRRLVGNLKALLMDANLVATGRKILVVEDDLDGASILEAYLRRDGFLVAVSHDGEHALQLHRHWGPDLVLLDILLPKKGGMDVLGEIRRDGQTPVIMVSAIGQELEKVGAFRYGADDYVVKPYAPGEVVARVHAVLRRVTPKSGQGGVLVHGRLRVDPVAIEARVASKDGDSYQILDLTPTEFNLLLAMAKAPLRAFARSELLEHCTVQSGAMERVVDSHIHNLRRKLESHGLTGVLATVRAVGYRLQ